MKSKSLRRTTLISLLGLSSAQTSTWGEPFSVDDGSPSTAPASTENLLSSAASIATSQVTSIVATDLTNTPSGRPSGMPSLSGNNSSFTVSLPNPTESGFTVSTPIEGGATSSEGTGAATKPTGQPYVKMGVVGVIAGAAGVLF